METRQKILEAALELFSKKGFNSSSVRDIAAKIGIKDSSLYFHYKNKQAILEALLDKFISRSAQMMSYLDDVVKDMTAMDDEQFLAVTQRYIRGYLMDPFIRRCMMIMNHERSHNEQLREQYISWCIKKPLAFQTTVMEKLKEIGYLKRLDTRGMALDYYAPIFLFFNQYMYDDTDPDTAAFEEAVMTAQRHFLPAYREEKGDERVDHRRE